MIRLRVHADGFAGVFTDVKFNKVNATLTASQVGSATFERNVPFQQSAGSPAATRHSSFPSPVSSPV
jgi:hypothetical protein